jgi:hypothetical protein
MKTHQEKIDAIRLACIAVNIKIRKRDIFLEDVLKLLYELGKFSYSRNQHDYYSLGNDATETVINWCFGNPLHEQSEATIDFIYELIK